ncbi:MAG: Hsp33 family molecular chaperone HslO [Gammaproteobacteria bacterium]|nr:Hsp33 family molecular chaperone HslO [Gammaproteobacteria bacterium]MDE2252465.1 Hsp33 family molecular chaperone HslO [Gammaproteobacteria bacterium]
MAEAQAAGELRRFLLEGHPLRGHWVRLGPAWQELRARRAYPPLVEALLGEAASAAVLLAATLKFAGTLTLQFSGGGRVRLLVAQCTDDFRLRAVAHHDLADGEAAGFAELVGAGKLVVTVQSDTSVASYQGIVPLAGTTLGECLERYFEGSEQLPTRLKLVADQAHAGGLLLQRLPAGGAGAASGEGAGALVQGAWEDLQYGLEALTPAALLGAPAELVVRSIAGMHDCRLFGATPVSFACRCSPERVAGLVRSLGIGEAHAALAEQGALTVTCEFCGRDYRYDAVDVEQLFAGGSLPQPAPGPLN